ncbi:short-chain dehydrogenase/reductase SDR [Gordonia bronchialis DSM 43247]|uniref:Short-chain dehydrogenase/reductase SDR n=1 Tax=Gordonia bronchialis (strain ATCC 25592 / DSM 43247 / BCRC 13721 / JCM 3198 / KCTC 3076 / NBRC 16047 / NCTC 10667) TaxID=526226 RepID=D0L7D5_GORB4|nr:3-oxoacyl-ACP reductase [Gordonia bronchialis]ACY23724.1 short-chain dehydrogenase/reductase SDR [Gordonia bronchialis DSM 43247]MCC3321893.1 3-oxoacyl-ACP reductase [Gordonia bronchialis]QGS22950.1 3-oxoacyl-ACP reductase [Gordonia bronchialis]STQ66737.1 3-oxoacyl-[acyl-carrier-protein] reductase FabG [Gordonia bronchialis]
MSQDAPSRATVAVPLTDQVVIVTGGARGLGRSISEAFLREGARVVVNYHRSDRAAEQLVADHPGRAVAVGADVRDRSQVDTLVAAARETFDAPVTTVVNNALVDFSFNGDGRPGAHDIDYRAFADQFAGAVQGAVNVIQAALPDLEASGSGRVINVGTNLFQNPVVPYHDYTAAKAALLSVTRTFAADLGPRHITVNMVSGGLLRSTDASAATPEAVFDAIAASTPLREVTTPHQFADAVLFFASPWSRAVTGQNLVVDGGLVNN